MVSRRWVWLECIGVVNGVVRKQGRRHQGGALGPTGVFSPPRF